MLVTEEKKCLRKQMNELLHNLPVAETAAGSSVICKTLGLLPDYHKARKSMYRDVWTRGIWKAYAFMI